MVNSGLRGLFSQGLFSQLKIDSPLSLPHFTLTKIPKCLIINVLILAQKWKRIVTIYPQYVYLVINSYIGVFTCIHFVLCSSVNDFIYSDFTAKTLFPIFVHRPTEASKINRLIYFSFIRMLKCNFILPTLLFVVDKGLQLDIMIFISSQFDHLFCC